MLDAIPFAFPNPVAGNGTFLKGFQRRNRERNSFPVATSAATPRRELAVSGGLGGPKAIILLAHRTNRKMRAAYGMP